MGAGRKAQGGESAKRGGLPLFLPQTLAHFSPSLFSPPHLLVAATPSSSSTLRLHPSSSPPQAAPSIGAAPPLEFPAAGLGVPRCRPWSSPLPAIGGRSKAREGDHLRGASSSSCCDSSRVTKRFLHCVVGCSCVYKFVSRSFVKLPVDRILSSDLSGSFRILRSRIWRSHLLESCGYCS